MTSGSQKHVTLRAKKVHKASSISSQLQLKWGCYYEHQSIFHRPGSQMGFCTAERVNKLFSSQFRQNLNVPRSEYTAWKQPLSRNKKKSLSEKKGAFSCDLRHVQMGFWKKNGARLMMEWINMKYQAELKHELKCMQKSHARQKETSCLEMISERKKSKLFSHQFVCLWLCCHISEYRGAHLGVGKTNKHVSSLAKRKKAFRSC